MIYATRDVVLGIATDAYRDGGHDALLSLREGVERLPSLGHISISVDHLLLLIDGAIEATQEIARRPPGEQQQQEAPRSTNNDRD